MKWRGAQKSVKSVHAGRQTWTYVCVEYLLKLSIIATAMFVESVMIWLIVVVFFFISLSSFMNTLIWNKIIHSPVVLNKIQSQN